MDAFLSFVQQQSAEAVTLATLVACYGLMAIFAQKWGRAGLYVYGAMAVIVGNIQVFKASMFTFSAEPIALGTAVFTSVAVAHDLLTEHFGPKAARQGVWISFMALLGMTGLMVLAVGSPPVAPTQSWTFWMYHQHLQALFVPMPGIFVASLVAYVFSQYIDIWLFQAVRLYYPRLGLWGRTLVSTTVAGFLDNALFSVLAWIILAPEPLPWGVVLKTYIWGTYVMRLMMIPLAVPVMYLIRPPRKSA